MSVSFVIVLIIILLLLLLLLLYCCTVPVIRHLAVDSAHSLTRTEMMIIIVIIFMQDIYSYIPETNHFLGFIIIIMSLVTGLFFLVLLLNQRWSPPLTFQASHCSTFRITCDVPSIAVFCTESIESFPGMAYKFLFKSFVTIPVAQITTGTSIHFMFHIRCTSIHKLLF